MTSVSKAKDVAETKPEKSQLGRTVVYSHCSAVKPSQDEPAKLEHSAHCAGVVIHERGNGVVDIDCTAPNGKRFIVIDVPHVLDVKPDASAKHAYSFTAR